MPETFRSYNVWEGALFLQNWAEVAPGKPRAQEGDIITMRREKVTQGIGLKEARIFMWVRLTGADDNDMASLQQPHMSEDGTQTYAARRYFIPLETLQTLYPTFDMTRARDPNDVHQPGINVDEDAPYFYLEGGAEQLAMDVTQVVRDKKTGGFFTPGT